MMHNFVTVRYLPIISATMIFIYDLHQGYVLHNAVLQFRPKDIYSLKVKAKSDVKLKASCAKCGKSIICGWESTRVTTNFISHVKVRVFRRVNLTVI